jgi:hypothetical protein
VNATTLLLPRGGNVPDWIAPPVCRRETALSVRPVALRALATVPVLALVAVATTGCDSKAGAAAVVNGTRISEKTVGSFVASGPSTTSSSAGATGSSLNVKNSVTAVLVLNVVLPRLLGVKGVHPTESDLSAQRPSVLGSATETDVATQLRRLGFDSSFSAPYLRERELVALIKTAFTGEADLRAATSRSGLAVSINPRYGRWDGQTLSISQAGGKSLPSVVSLTTPLPADQPTAGQ